MKQWFDQKNAPEQGHVLCRSDEIEIGRVKEFEFGESIKTRFRMFVYRSENDVLAYLNSCPHFQVPLNIHSGKLFSSDRTQFQCCQHYAKFDKTTGICTDGPCEGRSLTKIPIIETNEEIFISEGHTC